MRQAYIRGDRPLLYPQQFHNHREFVHRALLGLDRGARGVVKQYEGDYEFEEAVIGVVDLDKVLAAIKTDEYKPVITTYIESMGRLQAFQLFPLNLMLHMQIQAIAMSIAISRAGHDPADLWYTLTADDHVVATEAYARIMSGISGLKGGWENYVYANGTGTLKDVLHMQPKDRKTAAIVGVEAMLAATITAAYAALETLAEDLWIAAVDRHAELAINWAERNDKKVSWSVVAGKNLAKGMGSLFVRNRSVQFNSLNEIKSAYKSAFGDAMSSVFDAIPDALHAEKVRHLLAHRAGMMDAKFKDEMKNHVEYQGLEVGEQIPINGPSTKKHLQACLNLASAIILAVDNWSSTAPI